MPKPVRKYGKQLAKSKGDRLFVELPQTPVRRTRQSIAAGTFSPEAAVETLAKDLSVVRIHDENTPPPEVDDEREEDEGDAEGCEEDLQGVEPSPRPKARKTQTRRPTTPPPKTRTKQMPQETPPESSTSTARDEEVEEEVVGTPREPTDDLVHEVENLTLEEEEPVLPANRSLRILTWSEVCPHGDQITKIAEASYAEVYRVTNERGTSIIKVIRMESPIKPQTKQQITARLVDEQPHSESDLVGELKISQLLADIPGFVMYKERYIVQGKTCRQLLETHQGFQKKIKRKDPGRSQFYPSPSRYLDDTKFLVVELGDAGVALEDFVLDGTEMLWDIFLHCAIALARAEARVEFEHRDLHESNLCIRKIGEPVPIEERDGSTCFGHSGLDITILDYGLSRASIYSYDEERDPVAVAYDMERDLSLFRSEHAPQCKVYRRMRSFLLRDDRECLPPSEHCTPYQQGIDGPIDWRIHEPYTNVLWLAYLFEYMTKNFRGSKKDLTDFKKLTKDLWHHLDPDADSNVPGFESASDIVRFAVESGWADEDQLMGGRDEIEKSILSVMDDDCAADRTDLSVRRSPRKPRP